MTGFSHFDDQGAAIMVDVSNKAETTRSAAASGRVLLSPTAFSLVQQGKIGKGDVLGIARVAGIMGAKRTPDLIPLCHPLALTSVKLELTLDAEQSAIIVTATCKVEGKTGVEMEALTAVSIAALTVYDMVKAVDKSCRITDIHLVEKSGGKSGLWQASA